MRLFSKAEPVLQPPQTDEQRLAGIDDELRAAEAEITVSGKAVADYADVHKDLRLSIVGNSTAVQLGAMSQDPERQTLEGERDRALQKFHDVLRKRADLMATLGLIR
jgi:hypothetical protein